MTTTDQPHALTFEEDDDGWDFPTCECGWVGPVSPDKEIAAEFYAEHAVNVLAASLTRAQAVIDAAIEQCRIGPARTTTRLHEAVRELLASLVLTEDPS